MRIRIIIITLALCGVTMIGLSLMINPNPIPEEDCVFNTVFGETELDSTLFIEVSEEVKSTIQEGLIWIEKAQHPDGGWGAGFHSNQREMDPHKVPADPATTAMVSMALLRTGSNLEQGPYSKQLLKATEFLLSAVENAKRGSITELTGTQIQRKLGNNIDIVLTTQYFNNLVEKLDEDSKYYNRVYRAIDLAVDLLENKMDKEGKVKGAGWAGVLQSAFATSALEASDANGIAIDKEKLAYAKNYQSSNYDPVSESIETKDGAGIMLYSVSGSVRANAKDARIAKEKIKKAKEEGLLEEVEVLSYKSLMKAGVDQKAALKLEAASKVYESAKVRVQEDEVVRGFGNNGGEEFLSFLQTGESLVIGQDNAWAKWFDSMSANLVNIQNPDGSWNGHHCITSPVFCTATCLLILSINEDI
ncbi:MAG: hypothetical protein AAGK97_08565, partial [Bacteroidota bacterium]